MRKHLYDTIANRWIPGNGSVWIISDPHFNDADSKYFRKDYPGDDALIKAINSNVCKNDTIVFLGDIGDLECVKRIRGYKVLLLGNHDGGATKYHRTDAIRCPKCHSSDLSSHVDGFCKLVMSCNGCGEHGIFDRSWEYDDRLFDEVYEGPLMINDRTILSHEPIPDLPPYLFNIHGHTHDLPFDWDASHRNVCAEAIGYKPINLLRLFEDGLLSDVKDIHRHAVDKATRRKNHRV